jgi:hypothetical protein
MAVVASAHSRTSEKREPVEKLEDGGKKRVIRANHDCWTDQNGISKCTSNRQFALTDIVMTARMTLRIPSSWTDSITPTRRDALPPRNHLNICFSPLRDAGQNSSIAALSR